MNELVCESCKNAFPFSSDDERFLARVSPTFQGRTFTIPPPTRCPECRVRRRMAWRNDRSFHHGVCSLTGKRIISIYPPETTIPVCHFEEWYSDRWDPMAYGRTIDLSRPFFEQWHDLMLVVPRLNVDLVNCENSDYCNYCGDDKNCYLDIAGEANEDCYYNLFTKYSKDCVDNTFIYHSTLCYECINSHHTYASRYSTYLDTCSNCTFCFDLKGCNNCLFCTNLRNKEYYIFNEPCTKTEYERYVQRLNLGSFSATTEAKAKWEKFSLEHGIYRDMYATNAENCFGNDIHGCENCSHVFNVTNCEDCKFLYDVLDAKDCYDLNYSLYHPEVSYELISTLQLHYSAFNMATHYSSRVFYCSLTNNSHDLFGCIGLNHKEYCILNQQYTREEYERLVPQLIEHMNRTGEWGEFFPETLSPFPYNETVAQEYLPLEASQARERGYPWREVNDERESSGGKAITWDSIGEVPDSASNEVFSCSACAQNFRMIRKELAFYRTQEIPLPRLCPNCRHRARSALRAPRALWKRDCANCGNEVTTSYPPSFSGKVYCEVCYLKDVY